MLNFAGNFLKCSITLYSTNEGPTIGVSTGGKSNGDPSSSLLLIIYFPFFYCVSLSDTILPL